MSFRRNETHQKPILSKWCHMTTWPAPLDSYRKIKKLPFLFHRHRRLYEGDRASRSNEQRNKFMATKTNNVPTHGQPALYFCATAKWAADIRICTGNKSLGPAEITNVPSLGTKWSVGCVEMEGIFVNQEKGKRSESLFAGFCVLRMLATVLIWARPILSEKLRMFLWESVRVWQQRAVMSFRLIKRSAKSWCIFKHCSARKRRTCLEITIMPSDADKLVLGCQKETKRGVLVN